MFNPQTIPVAKSVPVSDHVPFTVPVPVPDLFAFLSHSCFCTCSVFETITVPVPIPVPDTGLLKQWWNRALDFKSMISVTLNLIECILVPKYENPYFQAMFTVRYFNLSPIWPFL